MRRLGTVIVLLVAVLALIPRPGAAQDSWLDGAPEGWNAAGAEAPAAPATPGDVEAIPASPTAGAGVCAQSVRSPQTDEDDVVTAQGWWLLPADEHEGDISLVAAGAGFDAMCRPVYYQRFVFVDGVFAGTLAPEPMVPRADGALIDAEIRGADRVSARYVRYAPTDPLCCPSGEAEVVFAIQQTPDGPVLVPEGGQAVALPAGSEQAAPGETATVDVCIITGTADDLALESLTQEEIAAYEATGAPLATPHPTTETCRDPAGLPVIRDFLGGFSWVCLQNAAGEWYGPQWTAEIYLLPSAVPPDPAIGGCPHPRVAETPESPAPERATPTAGMAAVAAEEAAVAAEEAAATAVYLSQLEAAGDLDTLYAWLHPDAQAVIPRDVVSGWYTAEWLPREPQPIDVISVDFGEWTWEVTGASYANVAEIAYEQPLGDGSTVRDVVRLVQDDQGMWRWFFGRDQAFVEEQIARFASDEGEG